MYNIPIRPPHKRPNTFGTVLYAWLSGAHCAIAAQYLKTGDDKVSMWVAFVIGVWLLGLSIFRSIKTA